MLAMFRHNDGLYWHDLITLHIFPCVGWQCAGTWKMYKVLSGVIPFWHTKLLVLRTVLEASEKYHDCSTYNLLSETTQQHTAVQVRTGVRLASIVLSSMCTTHPPDAEHSVKAVYMQYTRYRRESGIQFFRLIQLSTSSIGRLRSLVAVFPITLCLIPSKRTLAQCLLLSNCVSLM